MKMIHHPTRSVLLLALLLTVVSTSMSWLTGQSVIPSVLAQAAAPDVAVVNAATYASDSTVAPNSIAAAFGVFKTQNGQPFAATTLPLPTLLGGVRVTVGSVDAKLFFTSNGQINFLVPAAAPTGTVNIVVTNADNTTKAGTINVASAVPGIFTANTFGYGTAAAQTT